MTKERFASGGQVNSGSFYPYYGELETEDILDNKHRGFGMNTSNR